MGRARAERGRHLVIVSTKQPVRQAHQMSEAELRTAIVKRARALGWAVHQDGQERRVHKAGDPGFPDLALARDGELVFIETKAKGQAMTPEQWCWFRALGARVSIIYPDQWERVE